MSITDYNPQEDGDKLVKASAMYAAFQAYHQKYLNDKDAVMHYRGSVDVIDPEDAEQGQTSLYGLLTDPTVTLTLGDIYNVLATGENFAYKGAEGIADPQPEDYWDQFGVLVDLSSYATIAYVDGKFNTNVTVNGNITANGEVTAVESVQQEGQTVTVNHRLTEKLDADDYHAGYTWGEAENKFTWATIRGDHSTAHSTTTPNLHLTKPGLGDPISVSVLNNNFDILDTAIEEGGGGGIDEDDYLSGITWDTLAAKFTWDDLMGTQSSDSTTTNLSLAKPAHVSAAAMNSNMDILDSVIGDVNVSQDGSLQSQISTIGDSVSPTIVDGWTETL